MWLNSDWRQFHLKFQRTLFWKIGTWTESIDRKFAGNIIVEDIGQCLKLYTVCIDCHLILCVKTSIISTYSCILFISSLSKIFSLSTARSHLSVIGFVHKVISLYDPCESFLMKHTLLGFMKICKKPVVKKTCYKNYAKQFVSFGIGHGWYELLW